MYQILESNDYETLTYLFYENGLEITPGIHKPDEVIKFWECKDSGSQQLIGGVALEARNGEFVIADLAVNIENRNQNIGTRLMEVVDRNYQTRRNGSLACRKGTGFLSQTWLGSRCPGKSPGNFNLFLILKVWEGMQLAGNA